MEDVKPESVIAPSQEEVGVLVSSPETAPKVEEAGSEPQVEQPKPERKSPMVPYERFREVNRKFREVQTKLEALEQKSVRAYEPATGSLEEDNRAFDYLLKQHNVPTRSELIQETIDDFADEHEGFYGATPEGDANWEMLKGEWGLYNPPTSPRQARKLLVKIHNDLFGKSGKVDEEALIEKGKKQAYAQQVTNRRASIGSGSVQDETPAKLAPEIESRLSTNPSVRKRQLEILQELE